MFASRVARDEQLRRGSSFVPHELLENDWKRQMAPPRKGHRWFPVVHLAPCTLAIPSQNGETTNAEESLIHASVFRPHDM